MPNQYEIKVVECGMCLSSGQRQRISIDHRLSTIQNADMILVLEDEKIIQQGTHRELIEEDGLYRRLNLAQNQVGVAK